MKTFKQFCEATEMHPCKGCGRDMAGPLDFCLFCQSKLKEAGLCAKCGTEPRKPKSSNGQQSKYCEKCQRDMINYADELRAEKDPWFTAKYRGSGSRENTRDTKFGTGH